MRRLNAQELFVLMRGEIYSFACRRCSSSEADDITSETFVTVWRKESWIPADLDACRAWVYTIARNHVRHAQRTLARQSRLRDRLAVEAATALSATPDLAAEVLETFSVAKAFGSLSQGDQAVLKLSGWEHFTARQAAVVLGITEAAYSSRVRRARAHLGDALSHMGVTLAMSNTASTQQANNVSMGERPRGQCRRRLRVCCSSEYKPEQDSSDETP